MRALKPDPTKDPTLEFETTLLAEPGVRYVVGVDEAGRGAIAGPVAVGVHVLELSHLAAGMPVGLRDSKLLSEKRREATIELVVGWGAGAVAFGEPQEIDTQGITHALAGAGRRALLELHEQGIDMRQAVIVLDGSHDWLSPALKNPLRVKTRVGGDRAHASVAAASLRAKVFRDRLMGQHAVTYPEYGWGQNKGYGSTSHYTAIQNHGVTELHRKTWIKS